MEKIIKYIKQGKGQGVLFLLAGSVLIVTLWMFTFKHFYATYIEPQVLSAAEQILPITIERGIVVEPRDTYKRVEIDLSNGKSAPVLFPIVLDTREDASGVPTEKMGVFVMSDAVYVTSKSKIERWQLADGTWDTDGFKVYMTTFVGMVSFLVAGVLVLILFIVCLFKALAVAFVSNIVLRMLTKVETYDFSMLMRLSSLLVVVIELLYEVMKLSSGVHISGMMRGLLAVVFIVVWFNKKQNKKV